jgi:NAD(P)H-flavin reductase
MLYTDDAYTPYEAEVVEFIQEHHDIFTIRLKFTDHAIDNKFVFLPGQFNMIYLYGVGEVAISIVNDRNHQKGRFEHTIQVVGRITKGMAKLQAGDKVGIRGPFGTAWPMEQAKDKNVVIVTGGLGNAPLVAATEEVLKNRDQYGKLFVLHGIRSSDLLIYDAMYTRWSKSPDTTVMMATSNEDPVDDGKWTWGKGYVTNFIPQMSIDWANTVVMTVGPEPMMIGVAKAFIAAGVKPENVFVSIERSMKCAIGHCGHCQLGSQFVCKDGAVYPYPACEKLLEVKGL